MRFHLPTLFLVLALGAPAAHAADGCVDCHGNPDFIVTNKKLYDYFQSWRSSIHGLEGVACEDCHGGSPKATDKATAHGSNMTVGQANSAVNFMNIPQTCGRCHDDFLQAYRKSRHSQLLKSRNQQAQGPNCVTCHGSLNAKILDIRNVRDTCQNCHNSVSENHPEIPDRAEHLLNDLNAIRGYQKFIDRRGTTDASRDALRLLDRDIQNLARRWHTFDLETIQADTSTLLAFAGQQRDRVRDLRIEQRKQDREDSGEGGGN